MLEFKHINLDIAFTKPKTHTRQDVCGMAIVQSSTLAADTAINLAED